MPREPKEAKRPRIRWGLVLRIVGWSAVFVSSALAARQVHRYVAGDPRFVLHAPRWTGDHPENIVIQGAVNADASKILRVFAPDHGRALFDIPLAERRRRLLAIDWIEDASLSRVWPNRLYIRIKERQPVAFVNLTVAGVSRLALIDAQGVLLERPRQGKFPFVLLRGVDAAQPESERKTRVERMRELLAELGDRAREISEVDVSALDNVRVVTKRDNRAIELVLGAQYFSRRLAAFDAGYPRIREQDPEAREFDLRWDGRIAAIR